MDKKIINLNCKGDKESYINKILTKHRITVKRLYIKHT